MVHMHIWESPAMMRLWLRQKSESVSRLPISLWNYIIVIHDLWRSICPQWYCIRHESENVPASLQLHTITPMRSTEHMLISCEKYSHSVTCRKRVDRNALVFYSLSMLVRVGGKEVCIWLCVSLCGISPLFRADRVMLGLTESSNNVPLGISFAPCPLSSTSLWSNTARHVRGLTLAGVHVGFLSNTIRLERKTLEKGEHVTTQSSLHI